MMLKRPIHPIHPGLILKNELEELNITPAVLVRRIKVSANSIYLLLVGKRAITADTALRLANGLVSQLHFG